MHWVNKLGITVLAESPLGRWIGRIPGVRRAYADRLWSRQMNLYHGAHPSYEQALAHCPTNKPTSWNEPALAATMVGERPPRRGTRGVAVPTNPYGLPVLLYQPSTYAVVMWLSKQIKAGSRIVDVGGAGGTTYWHYRNYFDLPPGVTWTVVDMPELIARGQALAAAEKAAELKFTDDLNKVGGADIILALGSLQYMSPRDFSQFLLTAAGCDTIIINKMSVTDRPEFWTQQSLMTTSSPYWVPNCGDFISSFEKINFELIDSWVVTELHIRIPFAPEQTLPSLAGFVFRRAPPGGQQS